MWFSGDDVTARYEENGGRITLLDSRYGTPGSSIFGWWGVIFPVIRDAQGQFIPGAADKYRGAREATAGDIAGLFAAAFGQPNDFLPVSDIGC